MHEELELTREVEAIQIPSGDLIHLPQGTKVMITQALGGTYTVATQSGLARIKSENADALGIDLDAEKSKQDAAAVKVANGDFEGAIWDCGIAMLYSETLRTGSPVQQGSCKDS